MGNRAALIPQADLTRTIKALRAAGINHVRIILRADRYIVESADEATQPEVVSTAIHRKPVL